VRTNPVDIKHIQELIFNVKSQIYTERVIKFRAARNGVLRSYSIGSPSSFFKGYYSPRWLKV
jgi:hypothetical protein